MWTGILRIAPRADGGATLDFFSSVRSDAQGGLVAATPGWTANAIAGGTLPPAEIEAARDAVEGWADAASDRLAAGAALFALIGSTEGGRAWQQLRRDVKQAGQRMRTLFELLPPPKPAAGGERPFDLRALPWELLRDDSDELVLDDFVFADAACPASRWVRRAAPIPAPWPLKVLVVIGPDLPGRSIDWSTEKRALLRLFAQNRHDVEFRFLWHPTVKRAGKEIASFKPHVLHFMGHGTGAGEEGQGSLELASETQGATEPWTATQIATHVKGAPLLLAVLNACGSGQGQTPFVVANAFLGAGARAVVAMASDIQGTRASVFAAALYRGLFEGRPVDEVVADARRALQTIAVDEVDWGVPRLVLSLADVEQSSLDALVRLERRAPKGSVVSGVALDEELCTFVDREDDRSELGKHLDDAVARPHLLCVLGGESVGKTTLAKWSLERLLCHGVDAHFLDFRQKATRDLEWLALLRSLREGVTRGAPGAHFHELAVVLNHVLAGRVPPSPVPAAAPPEIDALLAYDPKVSQPEGWMEMLWGSFRRGLASAATARPLAIVIDAFDACDPSVRQQIVPRLLEPIAQGAVPNVYVIIASARLLELDRVKGVIVRDVKPFEAAAARVVLGDFVDLLAFPDEEMPELLDLLEKFITKHVKTDWNAARFQHVRKLLTSLSSPGAT